MKKSGQIEAVQAIGVILLSFIVANAATIWLTNVFSQQRAFGFLLSAELTAFSLLIYVYDKGESEKPSKAWLSIGFSAIAALLILCVLAPS